MKIIATFSTLAVASAIAVAGCGSPRTEPTSNTPVVSEAAPDHAKEDAAAAKKAPVPRVKAKRVSPAKAPTGLRVAEAVTPPAKIKNVQPVYPPVARAARIEGSVVLALEVNEDGRVSEARVLQSVPLLDQAALEAVMQWEYSPMRRGDVAVPSVMTVTVNFTTA